MSVLGEENLVEKNNDTAIFKLDLPDPKAMQDRLGGTIKIIEMLDRGEDIKGPIQKILEKDFRNHKGKVPFAINILNFKNPRQINIKELLNFSKKILKSLGLNARFINKDFQNTPPSTIFKSRVIEKGIDINIIRQENGFAIGKTVTIQNIDSYSKRDFSKPWRDAKIGMLPPKLAQILINLAGPNTSVIYDPFCGTGTVLLEGLLMGKTVVGSDIDPKLVDYSQKNCEWLEREYNTSSDYKIFEKDAQLLDAKDIPNSLDAIVTEGYLGAPFSNTPSPEKRDEIFAELAELHKNWLTNAYEITPPNCKIVMCKTAYKVGETIEHFPAFEELAESAGYEVTKTFTYDRPNQIVIRDIAILEKI
ncbi:MAG: DNA methyltransferase [Nitrospirota bacterium]